MLRPRRICLWHGTRRSSRVRPFILIRVVWRVITWRARHDVTSRDAPYQCFDRSVFFCIFTYITRRETNFGSQTNGNKCAEEIFSQSRYVTPITSSIRCPVSATWFYSVTSWSRTFFLPRARRCRVESVVRFSSFRSSWFTWYTDEIDG